MPEYEQTGTIAAEADVLFDYLAEVDHLPLYLPIVNDAHTTGAEGVMVEADIHGEVLHADGWLHVDALDRRMEWGTSDGPYHGWLQVEPEDTGAGSIVTIHVHQEHESDADDDLVEALDNIRRLADTGLM